MHGMKGKVKLPSLWSLIFLAKELV